MQRARSVRLLASVAASSGLLLAGSAPGANGTPVPSAQAPIVVGIDGGGGPYLTAYDRLGRWRAGFLPYFDFTQGGIDVATGDVDRDGKADVVTVPGIGGRGELRTFDGSGARKDLTVLANSGGCGTEIATGDVNGDGRADLVTGLALCAPQIQVFDGATGHRLVFFTAFNVPQGNHGIRVAAGDVTGDGRAEVITGAGPGDGSTVRVFSAQPSDFSHVPLRTFDAFGPSVTGGVEVAAADVTGDGRDDVVVAAETPDDAQVRVFDGATGTLLHSFRPFGLVAPGTLRVAAGDVDGDGSPEIVVSASIGSLPTVRVLSADGIELAELQSPLYGGRSLAVGDLDGNGKGEIVMGSGPSYDSSIVTFDLTGTASSWFQAYGYSFTNGVRVAVGDVDGDGTLEYVSGQGPGGESELLVLDEAGNVLHELHPFGLTGAGLYVACGDVVDGDGKADVVAGNGFGEPRVDVFDGTGRERSSFDAFDLDFQGGVRVATGDLDGDGRSEIVAGTGPGAQPVVRTFDAGGRRLTSFYAFDPSASGGIYVAAGDVTGDGVAEIVVGSGTTGEVRVFDSSGMLLTSFSAYGPSSDYTDGVRVAVGDVDGDGVAEIVTGPGRVRPADVEIFSGAGRRVGGFSANQDFQGGLFVAAPAPLGPGLALASARGLRGREGSSLQLVASFFDPLGGADPTRFGATIDWGDGRSYGDVAALGGGRYQVTGTNRYFEPGRYRVTVHIADDRLRATSVSTTATVTDAPLVAHGRSLRSGARFNGLVTTVRDTDPFGVATDLRARIDWGDGTRSAGSVVDLPGRPFGVLGRHRFRDHGRYRVVVRVRSTGGATARATSTIHIES